MMRVSGLFVSLLLVLVATRGPAAGAPDTSGAKDGAAGADAQAAVPDLQALAKRVWSVTEIVLENHVEPPARQAQLLAGVRALLQRAGTPPPAGLGRRISELRTEEEFREFLQAHWPKPAQPVPQQQLQVALFAGLVSAAPGRCQWLTSNDLKIQDQLLGNRYVGIGIQIAVKHEEKLTHIVTSFPGGPAYRAGMKRGDRILEVDGVAMKGKSILEVVEALRGEEGTTVSVQVRQPDSKDARTLTMVRSVVPFQSVLGYRRTGEETWSFRVGPTPEIAYLRLTGIKSSTLHELRQLEPKLQVEGFRALVLDLRFSVGGEMASTAVLADGLLDGGVLWKVRDAQGRVKEYRADRDCLFRGWPMVVLVNGQTAGSELLAAALQDNKRAALVGEPTRPGGGLIRTTVRLPDGKEAVVLWTGWVDRASPASRRAGVQELLDEAPEPGWSVGPDHPVMVSPEQRSQIAAWLHANEVGPRGEAEKAPGDPQLAQALRVLQTALKESAQR